jgi:hypothetical protein
MTRASATFAALLAATSASLAMARQQLLGPALINVEKKVVQQLDHNNHNNTQTRYENTTVAVQWDHPFQDPLILNEVSTLYQVTTEYTFYCFADRPDGSRYNQEAFALDPLRLADEYGDGQNVVVGAIECLPE